LICDGTVGFVLRVKDTGIGISPDVQKTLFHIFQVGDDTATRRYGGMGVGLALVSRMLDLVKGTVSFQSHIGVGTTFTVTFPFPPTSCRFIPYSFKEKNFAIVFLFECPWLLKELRRHSEFYGVHLLTSLDFPKTENVLAVVCGVEHVDTALALGIQGLNVVVLSKTKVEIENCKTVLFPISANDLFKCLVAEAPKVRAAIPWNDAQVLAVEDTNPSQLVLEKIFEKVGCKLTIVESAEEALQLLETREFDVILMDHYLPGMTGPEATELIRRKSDVPVIAMTASTRQDDIDRWKTSGVSQFLEKPILIAKVRSVLQKTLAGRVLAANR
jgi:two-component system sensor histidine kinase BarA